MTRSLLAFVFVLLAAPAFAQFGIPSVVLDPSNLAKNSITAYQTELMVRQMLVMIERLPGINRYRIPGLPGVPVFLPYRLEQLARVYPVVHPLIASHVVAIDKADEAWERAQHHIAGARQLDEEALSPALEWLGEDITNGDPSRSMGAALDALNANELVARRQGQAGQALLSSLLELEALRAQRDRESAWQSLLMRAGFLAQREYCCDTTAWATWRMP